MLINLVIFFGGMIIGILGVLFGATMFISLPFWQILFPQFSYAQLIANIRIGSLTRGIASTISTWKRIAFWQIISIVGSFTAGSVIGTIITTKLPQRYLVFAVFFAIVISEISPKIAHLITRKTRFFLSFLFGVYGSFIGPGISILIVALLRTYFPGEDKLVFIKIQSPFIELIGTVFSLLTNVYYGNLVWNIALYWAAGMFFGGYIGGHFLKKSIHFSPKRQRLYLYLVYGAALVPAFFDFLFQK